METKIHPPKFQIQKIYADGSREEPAVYELHELPRVTGCRMGRRGFILTSAVGAGLLAGLAGCVRQPEAQAPQTTARTASPDSRPQGSRPRIPEPTPRAEAPRAYEILAHRKRIISLTFSPDGKTLFSAAANEFVKSWSIPGGKLKKTFTAFEMLDAARFSADGRLMVTAESVEGIKVWPAPFTKHGKRIKDNNDFFNMGTLAVSPGGKLMAVASHHMRNTISVFSLPKGALLTTLEPETEMHALVFSRDGSVLAGVGSRKSPAVWAVPSGKLLVSADGRGGWLDLSPDGSLIAVATFDDSIRVYDRVSGEEKQSFYLRAQGAPVFSPNGKWLAVPVGSGVAIMIVAGEADQDQAYMLQSPPNEKPTALAFSRDGRFLATGIDTGRIDLWEIAADGTFAFRALLFDAKAMDKEVSARTATIHNKSIYVGKCGDPLPPGAVCTCDCISGKYAPPSAGGGLVCTCDTICVCVPVK